MIFFAKNKILKKALLLFSALTLLAPSAFANDAMTETGDESYMMVMSLGPGPSDQDVLITKLTGNLFTFKYCPARDKDGNETSVAKLRNDRYAHPERYSENSEVLAKILKDFFNDPSCETIGGRPFGFERFSSYTSNYESLDDSYPVLLGIILIGTAASANVSVKRYTAARKLENTLNTFRFVFSKRFPFGATFFTVVSASAASALMWFKKHADVNVDEMTNFKLGSFQSYNGPITIVKIPMEEFKQEFEQGLKKAVEGRNFIPL